MAQYKWKQIDKVLPAGGVALTGSLTISDTLTVPGELIYSGSTLNTYINNQVYSSSNDWDTLSNKPAGLFSGSFVAGSNVTISQDGQTVTISTTAEPLPAGVVSGSQQVISLLPSGTVSGSGQVNFLELGNLPSGLISSSAQILPISTGSITDFNTEVSRSAAAFGFSIGEVLTSDIQDSVVTASLSGENLIMTKRDLSSFSVNLGSLSPDIDTGSFFYSASFATAPDQLTFYNADGTLIVDLAGIAGSINDGDVTAVFAGDGLGGGGEAGNLVLSVNTSPSYGTNVVSDYVTIATSSLYFKKGVSTALTEHGVTGSLEISEDLVVKGTVTAQEFHSEFVSASIIYESGSTKFGDTQDDNHAFTGSLGVSGSLTTTGNVTAEAFIGDGSQLTGLSADTIFTGSVSASVNLDGNIFTVQSGSDEFLAVSSSGRLSVDLTDTGSTGIHTNNINVGYPSSNNWQENLQGSYFNNFDNDTHVSEILRFMAGVLSSSLDVADAKPNTKTFGSIDTLENNLGSTSTIAGRIPNNYSGVGNDDLTYLVGKGFGVVGGTLFNGISVYSQNGSTYAIDFDSNSTGTTQASSSNDTELFGLGSLLNGGANTFSVRVVATQSFSDSGSNTVPDENTNTFTTQSVLDLSVNSFGTSDGLTLTKIETSQPAVIPAAYQDGKFANVGGSQLSGTLTRKYTSGATDFTSVSSSGYYRFHDLKVGIVSGSQTVYTFKNGSTKNRFYAPISNINSSIGNNTIAATDIAVRNLTAVSRSLSGVPYLTDATFEISTKITGLFNPMYVASTSLVDMTYSSLGVGLLGLTGDTVSTSGGTIQTANRVYSNDGSTVRAAGSTPYYDDIVLITGSMSFDGSVGDNIAQTGVSDSSFQVQVQGRNRSNSSSQLTNQTINYHTAGTFDQPSSSGSLAVYGRAQGFDAGSLTGTVEQFTGESFRIQLTNDVLAFNGTAFDTTYGLNTLGDYDLQVKPGFLVDPAGTYRYWYPSGYGSGTYKYYIRRFQISGAKTTMTINTGVAMQNWNSTTDGVAAVVLFKSSASGSGANNELAQARIYDPTETTSNLIESNVSADNFKNPFTDDLDLYGNTGGSLNGATYTMPLRNVDGMYLDNDDNELYIIIRYKGDPTPITSLTVSTS